MKKESTRRKSAPKDERRPVERRPVERRVLTAPTPRPIPADHPAYLFFNKQNAEVNYVEPSAETSSPSVEFANNSSQNQAREILTPIVTPLVTPTATPTVSTQNKLRKTSPSSTNNSNLTASDSFSSQVSADTDSKDTSVKREPFEFLDATHSASEQQIYSVMYRLTISAGTRERHFGTKELCDMTGIRSHVTIRKAIDGLIDKQSIKIVKFNNGNRFGPRYRVFDPREIKKLRHTCGISVDCVTKKIAIVSPDISPEKVNVENDSTPTLTPTATPTEKTPYPYNYPYNNCRGTPTESVGVTPTDSVGVLYKIINTIYDESYSPSSSSKLSADDEKTDDASLLREVQKFYEQATGNEWTTADAATVLKARDIAPEIWGIAICYCLDRAPHHTFSRLAYVLDEARRHQEEMKNLSADDLRAILQHSLRVIERARTSNAWTPAETKNVETKNFE